MENVNTLVHRYYRIHGLSVSVSCDQLSVCQQIHAILNYFELETLVTPPTQSHVTLVFIAQQHFSPIPTGISQLARYGSISLWQTANHFCLGDGCSIVQLDPVSGYASAMLHLASWEDPAKLRGDKITLITLSLFILLRQWQLYAMHAACVAKKGRGYLFVASGGCGKSTLALSLVRQGWDYLSDDSIVLRVHENRVEALPLRRDLYVHPTFAHDFPEIVAHWKTSPLIGERKKRVDMKTLYPEQAVTHCTPQQIIFPKIVPEPKTRLIPIDNTEALFQLMLQSGLLTSEAHRASKHLKVLTRLLHQTQTYQLLMGRDLKENPSLSTRFLPLIS